MDSQYCRLFNYTLPTHHSKTKLLPLKMESWNFEHLLGKIDFKPQENHFFDLWQYKVIMSY